MHIKRKHLSPFDLRFFSFVVIQLLDRSLAEAAVLNAEESYSLWDMTSCLPLCLHTQNALEYEEWQNYVSVKAVSFELCRNVHNPKAHNHVMTDQRTFLDMY